MPPPRAQVGVFESSAAVWDAVKAATEACTVIGAPSVRGRAAWVRFWLLCGRGCVLGAEIGSGLQCSAVGRRLIPRTGERCEPPSGRRCDGTWPG